MLKKNFSDDMEKTRRLSEEQYQEDIKLNHIILSDIWLYEESEKKFKSVKMELFGHCFLLKSSEEVIAKGYCDKKDELEYLIYEYDQDNHLVELRINEMRFRMSTFAFFRLQDHYKSMNEVFELKRQEFKRMIYALSDEMIDDPILLQTITNFITHYPVENFIDLDFIAGVESFLAEEFKNANNVFYSNELQRRMVSRIVKKEITISDNFFYTEDELHVNNSETIDLYLKDGFLLLVELIKTKKQIQENNVATISTYVLLNRVIVKYFSEKWFKDYGEYFHDIDNLDLQEAIARFCTIESIDNSDVITRGTFICFLMNSHKFEENNYISCYLLFLKYFDNHLKTKKLQIFEKKMTHSSSEKVISINDIDLMTGVEFENFVASIFSRLGYRTEITQASGDQGIDIISEKNTQKIGIQTKCYSDIVGNDAIQEVVAGRKYYNVNKIMVVTNRYFSKSAKRLAQVNEVILWDREILKEKIIELFS